MRWLSIDIRRSIPFVVGLMVALSVVLLVGGVRDSNGVGSPHSDGRRPSITYDQFWADPVEGGLKVDPSSVVDQLNAVVTPPSTDAASSATLVAAWQNAATGRIALTYSTKVVIMFDRPQFPDAASEFEGELRSGTVDGRLVDVSGYPTLVIEPGSDVTGQNPGAVQFVAGDKDPTVEDGLSVTIYGQNMTGDDLMTIERSMVPPASSD
jgi:hypothetical protein